MRKKIGLKHYSLICVGLILIVLLFFLVISFLAMHFKKNANTIGDIAYDETSSEHYVYVIENGKYIPFLVLTNQYEDKKTLLLRKDVLDEGYRSNSYSSYYENSEIDLFLNKEYYASLKEIQPLIVNTNVSIVDNNSIGNSGSETKNIKRNIFLLSCEELGFDTSVNAGKEGKTLSYFANPENRIANSKNKQSGWILRSPNTYFMSTVYAVGPTGVLDVINAYDKSGIRPAFCVESSAVISQKEGIINGSKVYVFQ